jgi:hypothetical protein
MGCRVFMLKKSYLLVITLIIISIIIIGFYVFTRYNFMSVLPGGHPFTITGYVADASYPCGTRVSVSNATVTYHGYSTITDSNGYFNITANFFENDPILTINSSGYSEYNELSSRMVNNTFYLIPSDLYRGVYLVVWNPEKDNPNNFLRKWNKQTHFIIVTNGASNNQLETLTRELDTDKYNNLTGGQYHSKGNYILVSNTSGISRDCATVIYFSPDAVEGGSGFSSSQNGIINYAEIVWNYNQHMGAIVIWHEIAHTVTAGGHNDEWPNIVSTKYANIITPVSSKDEKIFNCIYNSPPYRSA